ncbi:unnamed protein product [Ranitomeya imitator]|uniref:Uncharacterized protein n=1 Tax=Ranitomeya imitator TaxID=111125 RepID=A0ABN9LS04_9NEOB|nr:unnamed protein product [Ranitomeya imitator]
MTEYEDKEHIKKRVLAGRNDGGLCWIKDEGLHLETSLWLQGGRGAGMAAAVSPELQWDTMEQRKDKGQNLYHQLYVWKMQQLPADVHRFCDPETSATRRKQLLHLLRSLEDACSCQRLQILFSFSVPSPQVLELLCALNLPLVSAGAVSALRLRHPMSCAHVTLHPHHPCALRPQHPAPTSPSCPAPTSPCTHVTLVPCTHVTLVPCTHVTLVPCTPRHPRALHPRHPRAHVTLVPCTHSTLRPRHPRALHPRHPRALHPRHPRALHPRHPRALHPRHPRAHVTLVPCTHSTLRPRHPRAHVTLVPCTHVTLVPCTHVALHPRHPAPTSPSCPAPTSPCTHGTGYWEFLLQSRGLDVVAFDQNTIFPSEMRYTEVMASFRGP